MSAPLKILVVDDHPDMRLLIQENIPRSFDSECIFAASGYEAVEILKSNQVFDLIICDFQMPNGDGKFVFDHLQKTLSVIPFILHTSSLDLPKFRGKNFLGSVEKNDLEKIVELINRQFLIANKNIHNSEKPTTWEE